MFEGTYEGRLKRTRCGPGALAIFNGRRSLHRVRTVFGNKKRIMSVLSYAKTKHEQSTPGKYLFSVYMFSLYLWGFLLLLYILLLAVWWWMLLNVDSHSLSLLLNFGSLLKTNSSYFSLSHLPTTPTSEKNVTLYGDRVAKIYEQRGYQIHRNERGEVIVPRSKM